MAFHLKEFVETFTFQIRLAVDSEDMTWTNGVLPYDLDVTMSMYFLFFCSLKSVLSKLSKIRDFPCPAYARIRHHRETCTSQNVHNAQYHRIRDVEYVYVLFIIH